MFAWSKAKKKCEFCTIKKQNGTGTHLYRRKDGKDDIRWRIYKCKSRCMNTGKCRKNPYS